MICMQSRRHIVFAHNSFFCPHSVFVCSYLGLVYDYFIYFMVFVFVVTNDIFEENEIFFLFFLLIIKTRISRNRWWKCVLYEIDGRWLLKTMQNAQRCWHTIQSLMETLIKQLRLVDINCSYNFICSMPIKRKYNDNRIHSRRRCWRIVIWHLWRWRHSTKVCFSSK